MNQTILTLISALTTTLSYAQDLDVNEFYQYVGMEKMDSLVLQHANDSLWAFYEEETTVSFDDGQVYYAPDSAFRIYHIEGEGCGPAYCNPFYEIFWGYFNPKTEEFEFRHADKFYGRIDSILKIAEEQYLIFGNSSGRPRIVEGVGCQKVALVTFELEPCIVWEFNACTSSLADGEEWICEINWDSMSNNLSYRYQWYEEADDFRTYTVSGVWKYQAGKYVNVKEEKVFLK